MFNDTLLDQKRLLHVQEHLYGTLARKQSTQINVKTKKKNLMGKMIKFSKFLKKIPIFDFEITKRTLNELNMIIFEEILKTI